MCYSVGLLYSWLSLESTDWMEKIKCLIQKIWFHFKYVFWLANSGADMLQKEFYLS